MTLILILAMWLATSLLLAYKLVPHVHEDDLSVAILVCVFWPVAVPFMYWWVRANSPETDHD
jgi:hypothetical protein